MSNLLEEIEAQIAGAKTTAAKQKRGRHPRDGDGVAKIEGLTDAMLNEMIDLGNGIPVGADLKRRKSASITSAITPAQSRRRSAHTGKLLQGAGRQGTAGPRRDVLGEPVDGKGRSDRYDLSG